MMTKDKSMTKEAIWIVENIKIPSNEGIKKRKF